MELRDVLGHAVADAWGSTDITALAYDNRRVLPGTLFFCVPGFTRDGHDFAADAVAAGAAALVVQRPVDVDPAVPQVLVPDVRAAMATAAAAFHGDPTARLTMVGITGTNGKTTSAYLMRDVLEAAGIRTGLLGTIVTVVGGEAQDAVRTTPEAIDLQATFAAMLDAGDEACVMEVSSHALALHRADAIHWDAAIFTNLTQDHLDFHADMDEYLAAKRRLLEADPGVRILNVDDPSGAALALDFDDAVTVGIDTPADVQAVGVSTSAAGSEFTVDGVRFAIPLPGRFNVSNALGVIAAARSLGISDPVIAGALPRAGRVPGRFEPVDEGQAFAVLVDYAHTPDSLDNVLRAARELTGRGRVLCVFGAGGDRDRGKRPQMGAIAAAGADRTVITSDNPRSEDPYAILSAIMDGVPEDARDFVEVIEDRRVAIERGIALAADGDVVVIAGKGHEQGQELADGYKVPFDDVTVAREALRAQLDA
jgi:UDP-N-acetylmuramoyl-L-alanyl-D-glutamate--2,6-diaminopimelate ligase